MSADKCKVKYKVPSRVPISLNSCCTHPSDEAQGGMQGVSPSSMAPMDLEAEAGFTDTPHPTPAAWTRARKCKVAIITSAAVAVAVAVAVVIAVFANSSNKAAVNVPKVRKSRRPREL